MPAPPVARSELTAQAIASLPPRVDTRNATVSDAGAAQPFGQILEGGGGLVVERAQDEAYAADLLGFGGQQLRLLGALLGFQGLDALLQSAGVLYQFLGALRDFGGAAAEQGADLLQRAALLLHHLHGRAAGTRFDAAHAAGDAALRGDHERPDPAGAAHVAAAAQLQAHRLDRRRRCAPRAPSSPYFSPNSAMAPRRCASSKAVVK